MEGGRGGRGGGTTLWFFRENTRLVPSVSVRAFQQGSYGRGLMLRGGLAVDGREIVTTSRVEHDKRCGGTIGEVISMTTDEKMGGVR